MRANCIIFINVFVKPFLFPNEKGTRIDRDAKLNTDICAIIVKKDQVLLSISANDLSFINEEILSMIFKGLAEARIKLNMVQLSALNISICFDNDELKFRNLTENLKDNFKYRYNSGLELMTLRHYKRSQLPELTAGKIILMEQFSRNTAQLILK